MTLRMARAISYRARTIVSMLTGFRRPWQTIRIFCGLAGPGPWTICARTLDVCFEVRTPLEVWCLAEVVLDRCYEQFGFAIQSGWTVIDVGGGFGDFTTVAAREVNGGRVVVFEPYGASFDLLERNLARNGIEGVTAMRMAVTGTRRQVSLDRTVGEPLTIAGLERPSESSQEFVAVDSITLGEAVKRFNLSQVDLLKLDCEGEEYDIILGSPPGLFDRIDRIVMEYHDFAQPGDHRRLVTALEGMDYAVETFENPIHREMIGYLRASRS